MSLGTILIFILLLMLIGALPMWPHSRSWGIFPEQRIWIVLVIVAVLLLFGRI